MYYTYAHYSPEGEIFYIGKGTKDRAYSFSDRNKVWKQAVKYYKGLKINILAYWETEDEAYIHEIELINQYKKLGHDLVNLTNGGKGAYRYKHTEESKLTLSKRMTGFKHKKVICPHCGKSGGATSMKRWHFDNCTGLHPQFKIRTTVLGKRVYLGKAHTKKEADMYAKEFHDFVLEEQKTLNRPSGSNWVVI